jgi:hypothetical protein
MLGRSGPMIVAAYAVIYLTMIGSRFVRGGRRADAD